MRFYILLFYFCREKIFMNVKIIQSRDNVNLNCAYRKISEGSPWIVLILPFGLPVDVSKHFFSYFNKRFNLLTWESRLVLCDEEYKMDNKYSISRHVSDMHCLIKEFNVKKSFVVGYCSGAGIALAFTNRHPNLVRNLVLVHGEYTFLDDKTCVTNFGLEMDFLLSLIANDKSQLGTVFNKIGNVIKAQSNSLRFINTPFTRKPYLERYAENYVAYKLVNFEELAKFVYHKTLVLTGKMDKQTNINSSKKIHELMPNASISIDEDADHYGIFYKESNTLAKVWNYLYSVN